VAEAGAGAGVSAGPPDGLRPWPASALLAAATAAAYATSFQGGFQFDDWNVVVEDGRVQSLCAWWAGMPGIRPLLKLSFALNHQSGLGLAGFHAANLAIHLATALLALALLARLERRFAGAASDPARPGPSAAGSVPPAALLGALLFALHPAQTEAVTYLSGRSTALAALLCLASLLAWLDGRARGRDGQIQGLSPLLFLAALGVKETALALPPALLLLGLAGPGPAGRWRAVLRDTAAHWIILVTAAAVYAASPVYRALAWHAAGLRSPGVNLVTHLGGLGWLAGQLVRPWALAADPLLEPAAGFPVAAALTALALAALLAFGLAESRRRAAGLAVLWTLVWLPATGWLLPRPEPANDRQLYLALLGPAWLMGRWLAWPLASPGWRRLAAGVGAAALLGGLGVLTARRSLVYRDEVAFWRDATEQAPGNARALNNLGLALSAACRLGEAEAAFEAALAVDPRQPRARVNLWLLRQGQPPGERPGTAAHCPP
jgi:tetratricopeptide (TPR) repeat protein